MSKATRQQIIAALRCTAGEEHPGLDCKCCPYYRLQLLTPEQQKELGCKEAAWEDCDVERVALDAADLLESDAPRLDGSTPASEPPEVNTKVLCCTVTKAGAKNYVLGYYDGSRYVCGINSNVIAWWRLPKEPEDCEVADHAE